MGCIPVLFAETTDNVAPWFWGDWKERARLLVPYEDYMAGCVDLGKLLGGDTREGGEDDAEDDSR